MPSAVLPVIAGAAAGALLRYLFSLRILPGFTAFSAGTLAANLTGALIIGLAAAFFDSRPGLPPQYRLLLTTGFLGSLTTFSGFSLELVQMLQHQRYAAAAGTALLHLAGCLLLTWFGIKAGTALFSGA